MYNDYIKIRISWSFCSSHFLQAWKNAPKLLEGQTPQQKTDNKSFVAGWERLVSGL